MLKVQTPRLRLEQEQQVPDGQTDDELVNAARAGEEPAFALLFDRHARYVGRMAASFFSRRDDIELVIQETFTEAFLGLHSYRGGHAQSFVAWLGRITVTTCYDALRRQRRHRPWGSGGLSGLDVAALQAHWYKETPTAEQRVVSRDLSEKLLAELAPRDRIVLTLLILEELSVAEVAHLTGWSKANVKVRAYRARRTLRRAAARLL